MKNKTSFKSVQKQKQKIKSSRLIIFRDMNGINFFFDIVTSS